jgi:hypothetical protein
MAVVKFLFGSGWWIAWYLAFHAAILLFVVLVLIIFAQEVKPPGVKPATPSPGSIMVLMIMLTLTFFTIVNGILFVSLAPIGAWYVKLPIILIAVGLIAVIGYKVNIDLAESQSRAALAANVAYVVVTILANLVMMWCVQTRDMESSIARSVGA